MNPQNLEQYNDLLGAIEKSSRSDMVTIDIRTIDVNWDDNVRRNYNGIDALAESIKEHGLKDPLKVSKVKGEERYILVDGHRRYKAISSLLEAGVPISRVKAVVVSSNPETRLAEMIITGVQKQNLHPVEQAEAFLRLKNYGWDVKKIASMLGESGDGKVRLNLVYRYLKLAEAPEAIKQRCLRGEISHDTVIRIIETNDGDYEKTVEVVESAIEANTITNEMGAKEVKKVKTRDIFKKEKEVSDEVVASKKYSLIEKLEFASDEMFASDSSADTAVLDDLLKLLRNNDVQVEEIKKFFRDVTYKKF
jgi:ParB family transcriptional regulator, chromosome partitioning protein